MRNRLLPLMDKLMLRGRSIIDTINDQLKNQEQIEHIRHRSPVNFGINLFSGLIAYLLQPKKLSLSFSQTEQQLLLLEVVVHTADVQDRDGAKLVFEKAKDKYPDLQHI